MAQLVKNLPAVQETWVPPPGWKDPLKKEMATYSSTLAWRSSWTEKQGKLQSMGSQRVRQDCAVTFTYSLYDLKYPETQFLQRICVIIMTGVLRKLNEIIFGK